MDLMVFTRKKRVGSRSTIDSQPSQCPDTSILRPTSEISNSHNKIDASLMHPEAHPADEEMAGRCNIIGDGSSIGINQITDNSSHVEYIDLVSNDENLPWGESQLLSDLQNRQNSFEVLRKWGAYAALRVISNNLYELRPDPRQDANEAIIQEWQRTLAENELVFQELQNRIDIDQATRQEELRGTLILEEKDDGDGFFSLELQSASIAPSTPYSCKATISSSSLRWSEFEGEDDSLPNVSELLPPWVQSSESKIALSKLPKLQTCWLDDGDVGDASSRSSPLSSSSTSPVRWSDLEEDDSLPDVSTLLPPYITGTMANRKLPDVGALTERDIHTIDCEESTLIADDLSEAGDDAYSIQLETASLTSSDTSSFSPIVSAISEVAELCFDGFPLSESTPGKPIFPDRAVSPDIEESQLRATSKSQRLHRAFASLAGYLAA